MKEFDLQKAKAGAPVCTRDGLKARIVCFGMKNNPFPIIAVIDYGEFEVYRGFTSNGMTYKDELVQSCFDLMMADVPQTQHEGWVNIVYNKNGRDCVAYSVIYESKEIAENNCPVGYHPVKISWEDDE